MYIYIQVCISKDTYIHMYLTSSASSFSAGLYSEKKILCIVSITKQIYQGTDF